MKNSLITPISKLQLFILGLLYLLCVASNNITIAGYGRPKIILLGLIALIGIYVFLKNLLNKKTFVLPLPLQLNFFIIFIFSIINSLVINDFRIGITYFSFVFIFIALWIYVMEISTNIRDDYAIIFFFNILIYINILFILVSLLFDGMYVFRYRGIFDMPNSMGRFAACSTIITLVYFLFINNTKIKNLLLILVLLFSLIFLLLSNSRAPIAALIVSVFFLVSAYSIIKQKKIKTLFYLVIIVLVSGLILINYFNELVEVFAFKFKRGDGTSGRLDLWRSGLEYLNFFGSSEYNNISGRFDVHNNYLSQALKYGVINSFCFHIIPIYILYKSYFRIIVLKKLDPSLAIIIGMSSFLVIYYFFETASMIAPYYLMLFFTAISYPKIWRRNKS